METSTVVSHRVELDEWWAAHGWDRIVSGCAGSVHMSEWWKGDLIVISGSARTNLRIGRTWTAEFELAAPFPIVVAAIKAALVESSR